MQRDLWKMAGREPVGKGAALQEMVDIGGLTADSFEPHVNEVFRLDIADLEFLLTLSEVRRLGPSPRPGGAFALSFVTPPGPILRQSIFRLAHPQMGLLDIFLVPRGPQRQGGNLYEAVFN